MRLLLMLLALAAMPALAAEPAPDTPAVPAAAADAAPAAPAEAAPAGPAVTASSASAAPAEEFRAPAGYKKKKRDGETVYCRSETRVGTRFPTEYCFTKYDLDRIEKSKQSMQRDVQQRTKMCSTGSACSGGG